MVIKGLRLWLKSRRSGTNLSETWNLETGKDTLHRSQVTSASHCSVDKLLKWITEICYKTLFGIILIPHHEESLHLCHKLIVMTRVASDIQPSSRRNSGGCRVVLRPLLTDELTLSLINWLAHCVNGSKLCDGLIVWLINWLGHCLTGWLTQRLQSILK